jgi:hypothetical protein
LRASHLALAGVCPIGGLAIQAALALALGAGGDLRWAVRYDPGLMEHMAAKHGLVATGCHFAHPTLPIGTRARIEGVRTGRSEACTQADTSALVDTTGRHSTESDRQRHIRLKRIELGFNESFRICGKGWGGAAKDCPVRVWVIPDRVGR